MKLFQSCLLTLIGGYDKLTKQKFFLTDSIERDLSSVVFPKGKEMQVFDKQVEVL